MQARLADIVWVRKHDRKAAFQMAQLAVDAYLASARVLEDPVRWPHCFDRIRRAQQIAASLGRDGPLPKVITFIEGIADTMALIFFPFLQADGILLDMGQGYSAVYVPIARTLHIVRSNSASGGEHTPISKVLARWYGFAKNPKQNERPGVAMLRTR